MDQRNLAQFESHRLGATILRRALRILVLHESEERRESVRSVLASNGRDMQCVTYGCLSDVPTGDFDRFDVVVASVTLPGSPAPQLLDQAKAGRRDGTIVFIGPEDMANEGAELIRAGAADYVVESPCEVASLPLAIEKSLVDGELRQENDRLHHELTQSLVELELRNRELREAIGQLEEMARTDEVTGLANRRWLNQRLDDAWAEATRHRLPLAFIMIDLDGFKQLNDTAGHVRGDEILCLVGRIIEANCRAVDTCARYGGDEFSVLLPHTRPGAAIAVARRILREFRSVADHLPADEPRIGMSIGVSHLELTEPINAADLVIQADAAMYESKGRHGGNTVLVQTQQGAMPADRIQLSYS